MSIEELMDVEVVTAARKAEKWLDTAAAVYVITGEEIRRSSATSLPELLRGVPGVQVARADASKWAITARGFNDRFANKLQVLVDGRSIYSPLFSGVFWEIQDRMLEDIERIEIVRGPGAALWGANAVNGVINIITKDAAQTQGGLLGGAVGSEAMGPVALRWGGRLGERAHYRVYGRYFGRDAFVDSAGRATRDDWRFGRLGGRLDWRDGDQQWSLAADGYAGALDQTQVEGWFFEPPFLRVYDFRTDLGGGYIQGRWQRRTSEGEDAALDLGYEYSRREDVIIGERRHTLDADFQQRRALGRRHDLVWGAAYRFTTDEIDSTLMALASPRSRGLHLWSVFAQDAFALVSERLRLTLGAKLEHNAFTGLEFQPNIRALWRPGERQALWGAVSKAVRLPGRSESNGRFLYAVGPASADPDAPVAAVYLLGNEHFAAEELVAYELGYRIRPHNRARLEVAAYYNVYDHLRTGEPRLPVADPADPARLRVDLVVDSGMNARVWGIEPTVDWQVRPNWRLRSGYTYLHMDLSLDASSASANTLQIAGDNPEHQWHLHSSALLRGVEFDGTLRYVDAVPFSRADRYLMADVRLGWRWRPGVELIVAGRDLFDAHHREFDPALIDSEPTEIQRSGYGGVRWRF